MFTKKQQQILNYIQKQKKMPPTHSLDYAYVKNYNGKLLKKTLFGQVLSTVIQKYGVKIKSRNSSLNKHLILDFVMAEKRKPSRYSSLKEERRLWNVMAGYTSKSNPTYDKVFAKELNKLLESIK